MARLTFTRSWRCFPGGDALIAWENVSEVLIEPGDPGDPCIDECLGDPDPEQCQVECKLEEMKSKTEIAVAEYDALSGTWSAQTIITSNGILDRSPRIATADRRHGDADLDQQPDQPRNRRSKQPEHHPLRDV